MRRDNWIPWSILISSAGYILLTSTIASAQQNDLLDSTRPTISSGATIQRKGVLQIETGYDAYFLPYDQTGAVSLYYALTNWLRLDASLSGWRATDVGVNHRTEGVGNSEFGAKAVILRDGWSRLLPGLAVEYEETVRSATTQSLRSSYQQGTLILSKKLGPWKVKLNGSAIGTGCGDTSGCRIGGQGALGVTYSLTRKTSLAAEFFGQSVSVSAPPGAYAFAGLTRKLSDRLALNGGLRFGLSPSAPAIGATFGVTVAIGGHGPDL